MPGLVPEVPDECAHRVDLTCRLPREAPVSDPPGGPGPPTPPSGPQDPGTPARRTGTIREEAVGHAPEHPRPLQRAALPGEPGAQPDRLGAVRDEASEPLGVHLSGAESVRPGRTGHEPFDEGVRVRHRVPEQEAAQPLPPRMAGRFRQPLRPPVGLIRAPADSGFPDQSAQGGKVAFADPEPGPDRRRVERREDRFRPQARARQIEQVEERAQGARLPSPCGDVAGDASRRAEHRLDGGSVDREVRGQHEDIGRLEVRVGVEEGEKLVVQDLGFAQGRVADVDPERIVGRWGSPPSSFQSPGRRRACRRGFSRSGARRWGSGRLSRGRRVPRRGLARRHRSHRAGWSSILRQDSARRDG